MRIEYRLRPVTRYIVTRYAEGDGWTDEDKTIGSSERGEFDNADTAYEVAYALCRAEHEKLGYPPADERVQYPRRADECRPFPMEWRALNDAVLFSEGWRD